ncbi:hypothetical protein CFP56_038590 [Quercus suber]|uniref:Uncharacterized protein n=1 Tax=Quercus suber TaxID=58331 RepID=A0AAW0LLQ8_QUESU
MSFRYLSRQLWHKESKAPTACSVLTRDPSSTVSTRVKIPPSEFEIAIRPSSELERISSRAVVFSANLEYFLHSLRRLIRGRTAFASRIAVEFSGQLPFIAYSKVKKGKKRGFSGIHIRRDKHEYKGLNHTSSC